MRKSTSRFPLSSRLPLGLFFLVLAMFPIFTIFQLTDVFWKGLAIYFLIKLGEMFIDLGIFVLFDTENHDKL